MSLSTSTGKPSWLVELEVTQDDLVISSRRNITTRLRLTCDRGSWAPVAPTSFTWAKEQVMQLETLGNSLENIVSSDGGGIAVTYARGSTQNQGQRCCAPHQVLAGPQGYAQSLLRSKL